MKKIGFCLLLLTLILSACSPVKEYKDPFVQWYDYSSLIGKDTDTVLQDLEQEGKKVYLIDESFHLVYQLEEPEIVYERYAFEVVLDFNDQHLVAFEKKWSGPYVDNQTFLVDFWNALVERNGSSDTMVSGIAAWDEFQEQLVDGTSFFQKWSKLHAVLSIEIDEKNDAVSIIYDVLDEESWGRMFME